MNRFGIVYGILLIATLICIGVNLCVGFIDLDFEDFISGNSERHDIAQMRINRILVMFLAGISIPTSGFLLQEYFQNPLAGPSVLGITSVAGLFVVFYIFFSKDWVLPEWLQSTFMSFFAIGGSLLLTLFLLIFSNRFQDKTYLIIFGFLISALAGALVSIFQLYSDGATLKHYILWSFGANHQITTEQIGVLSFFVISGLVVSFFSIKPLIGNSLGLDYARSLGVNSTRLKALIICASSLLSASVTAFLGPILFVGIVVPHLSRMLWNPSQLWHQWLLNMVLGVLAMEGFSILAEVSLFPINIITSLFGVPLIIMMTLRQKHNQ